MHVKEFNGTLKEQRGTGKEVRPVNVKDTGKEKFFASLTVSGEVPKTDARLVDDLKDALRSIPGRRAAILILPGGGTETKKKDGKDFALGIDLGRSPNDNYPLKLSPPQQYPTKASPSPLPPLMPKTEPEAKLNQRQAGKGDEQ